MFLENLVGIRVQGLHIFQNRNIVKREMQKWEGEEKRSGVVRGEGGGKKKKEVE
jgi:hypothetical protein